MVDVLLMTLKRIQRFSGWLFFYFFLFFFFFCDSRTRFDSNECCKSCPKGVRRFCCRPPPGSIVLNIFLVGGILFSRKKRSVTKVFGTTFKEIRAVFVEVKVNFFFFFFCELVGYPTATMLPFVWCAGAFRKGLCGFWKSSNFIRFFCWNDLPKLKQWKCGIRGGDVTFFLPVVKDKRKVGQWWSCALVSFLLKCNFLLMFWCSQTKATVTVHANSDEKVFWRVLTVIVDREYSY